MPNITEYLKVVPIPCSWQKFDLNHLSISELFEEILSLNSESKLIIPKYVTGTYFGAIVAIFNFYFFSYFLCVMFFLTPDRAPKAGPCHLFQLQPSRCQTFLSKITKQCFQSILWHDIYYRILFIDWWCGSKRYLLLWTI